MIRVEVAQGSVAFARMKIFRHVGPAIDDHAGLKLAQHGINLVGLPVEAPLVGLTCGTLLPLSAWPPLSAKAQPVLFSAIKKQDVYLPVIREKLPHLAVVLVAHCLRVLELQIGE